MLSRKSISSEPIRLHSDDSSSEELAVFTTNGTDAEQGQRLLSGDDAPDSGSSIDETHQPASFHPRTEAHIRTIWLVLAAVLGMVVTYGLFMELVRLMGITGHGGAVEASIGDGSTSLGRESWRRDLNEYVLDSNWDFEAPRTTRRFNWVVSERVVNPDGVFREMLTVDGKWPGPMIECNEGDRIVVEVENRGKNSTAIHFHGLFQNGTNWMDGAPGITQCPIAPGYNFTYEFTVKEQSGTYFWHGHHGAQMVDGLFGPMIVHSRDEKSLQKIPYTTDRVIMLQDYYIKSSYDLLQGTLSPGVEGDPIPNGALLNGQNTRSCDDIPLHSPSLLCDNTTSSRATIPLVAQENHRLRFINVGAFAWFEVGLDAHNVSITEADGTDLVPVVMEQLHIAPAQRYSVIVTTNQTSSSGGSDAFWLRARMITHCFTDPYLPANGMDEVRAIVRYVSPSSSTTSSPPAHTPTSLPDPTSPRAPGFAVQCRDMNLALFTPLPAIPAPSRPDHTYHLRLNIQIGDWRLERGFFNKTSFRPDVRSPILHRAIDGLSSQNASFTSFSSLGNGSSTSKAGSDGEIDVNEFGGVNAFAFDVKMELVIQHDVGTPVIDLVIQNFDEGSHPLHFHGHKVWVLAQGHAYFPGYEALNLSRPLTGPYSAPSPSPPTPSQHPNLNLKTPLANPLRRDVAAVEGYGWILLRYVADNPGVWPLHCHVVWHGEGGMVMSFLERGEVVKGWEVPEQGRRLCVDPGKGEVEKGGVPGDGQWVGFGVG